MDYDRLFCDTLDDEMRQFEKRIGRRLTAGETRSITKQAFEEVYEQSIAEFKRTYRSHVSDVRPSAFFRRRII